jgi:hypothetical protein
LVSIVIVVFSLTLHCETGKQVLSPYGQHWGQHLGRFAGWAVVSGRHYCSTVLQLPNGQDRPDAGGGITEWAGPHLPNGQDRRGIYRMGSLKQLQKIRAEHLSARTKFMQIAIASCQFTVIRVQNIVLL